jgi:hypothetical protein
MKFAPHFRASTIRPAGSGRQPIFDELHASPRLRDGPTCGLQGIVDPTGDAERAAAKKTGIQFCHGTTGKGRSELAAFLPGTRTGRYEGMKLRPVYAPFFFF